MFSGWSLGLQFFLSRIQESITSWQVLVAFAAFASTVQTCLLSMSGGLGVPGLGGAQSQTTDCVQGSVPGDSHLTQWEQQVLKGPCLDALFSQTPGCLRVPGANPSGLRP